MQIIAVHNHLRLVVRLSDGQRRIVVQVLRPGVVRSDLKSLREAPVYVDLQRVVGAVAFRVPEESVGDERIRTRSQWNVLGSLRHMTLQCGAHGGSPRGGCSAGGASGRIGADLRGDTVGIQADELVVSER